jgi:hypothetical protein
MPKCFIETPAGFSITPANAASAAYWQARCLDTPGVRIYPWPLLFNFTDQSEKAVYQKTPLGVRLVRQGRYEFLFEIAQDLCLHQAMFTHRTSNARIFIIDVEDGLYGTVLPSGNLAGFSVGLLNPEKLVISNGTVATTSPIMISLNDHKELDQNGFVIDGTFIDSILRLTDVTITPITCTTTVLTITVTAACDGTPVAGLLTADFIVLKASDGSTQTVVAAPVAGALGTYTLTGTALATGTINLRAASLLTVQAYELPAPQAFTVPFP